MNTDHICSNISRVISKGDAVINHWEQTETQGVPLTLMFSFVAECQALLRMLGPEAEQWAHVFEIDADSRNVFQTDENSNNVSAMVRMVGTLQGINDSIQNGLLNRIENVILAEAEGDLLAQARELFDKGYSLAAGVLGRAVLESHLRKWCEREGCSPTKDKPTLADYKAELYKQQKITKTEQAHIEAMAAVGNDAAHAKAELKQHDVERLLNDLTSFFGTHPLP